MSDRPRDDRSSGGFGRDERELELLAAYALGALEPGEEMEVERLLLDADGRRVADSLELVAAAATVAYFPRDAEPMPGSVRAALSDTAANWAGEPEGRPARNQTAASVQDGATKGAASGPMRLTAWAGWIAAAACLALAGVMWMPLTRQGTTPGTGEATMAQLARMRGELLERPGDVILASWSPLEEPDPTAASATGDIVWCTDDQTGVMRLSGLAANDPGDFQYQLWIFDEDQNHPIDGGVFDIPAGADGDVMVAVDPKIAVSRPTMFAITVERPGGVVVSARDRIALLGADLRPAKDPASKE